VLGGEHDERAAIQPPLLVLRNRNRPDPLRNASVSRCTVKRHRIGRARKDAVRKKRSKPRSQPSRSMSWRGVMTLGGELLGVDREQVEVIGDDRLGAAGCRERDEVVVARIPAHGAVRSRPIGDQRRLGGEVSDEPKCLFGGEVLL
jgi:hypothetical protein